MRTRHLAPIAALLTACSSGGGAHPTGTGGAGTGGAGGSTPAGPYARCGGAVVDPSTGKVNAAEYRKQATLWDRATVDCRLGPRFEDVHPGDADDQRPTAYEPPTMMAGGDGYLCPAFQLGDHSGNCGGSCDYGSTAGQVLYVPDQADVAGLDRVQTYAYEKAAICEQPQAGGWLGGAHPDPGIDAWTMALGHPVKSPVAFARTELVEANDGLVAFADGLVGATGTQTSGDTKPFLMLPKNKVPTAIAVTSYNEFALVTVWDTEALKGQVAVLALRAPQPGAFSIPYFGLPNEGGFANLQLLGLVDLPDLATPTAIAGSGDSGGKGGTTIGNSDIDDPTLEKTLSDNGQLAGSGWAVVASRWEGKVTFLDLQPLFAFVRAAYFTTPALHAQAKAQDVWPFSFETNPEMKPVVVRTLSTPQPMAVGGANRASYGAKGFQAPLKAYVGSIDGDLVVYDLSALAGDQPRPVAAGAVRVLTQAHPASSIQALTVRGNDDAVLVSRADRAVHWMHMDEAALTDARTLRDARLGDPVSVDVNDRGPLVTLADFAAGKVLSFRVGPTENNGGKPPANYGCGPGGSDALCTSFEFGGELAYPGAVFRVDTTNVN